MGGACDAYEGEVRCIQGLGELSKIDLLEGPGLYGRMDDNLFYFNTCTVHLSLFCTITNTYTTILQIITLLLNVSALFYHPQIVRCYYLAKFHKYVKCSSW